ncbi:MAG: glycosyltransferase family 4 protein [Vicinamibacterales bacterium]
MAGLRFGLLTTFYPPFNFGGDGIDVQRTARALVKRGHRVTVVHDIDAYEWVAGRRLTKQPASDDGVEAIGLRSRLGMVSPLLTHQFGHPVVHGRAIAELMRDRKFDVVVLNNVSLVGGPGLLSYGGEALKVYIAHEHWLVCPTHVLWRFNREPCDGPTCTRCVVSYRRPLQVWRYTGALERRLPEVDLFIARSEFSRDKHREFGFPRPMSVLPYFVPGEIPEQPEPRSTPRPHDRPYFLFVGRLTRLKGLDSLIEAFDRYRDADLLIVGDGEEEATLRALAGPLTNVKFLGRVANESLRAYYEHATAAIVPSIGYETFGIVLIEAFRYQTPVIARRLGPFPEIVDQSGGGLLFSDETELMSAMTRLQSDAGWRDALGARGYRACRERWSEDVVINRLLELVSEARAARARRDPSMPVTS